MPQALSGTRKSIPKICRVNGDDNLKVIYRNLGNNHAYPFVWGDSFTMVSGASEVVIASGVKFHGYTLASYANVTASPMGNPAGYVYIDKDTTNNIVKVVCTAAVTVSGGLNYDVKFMLGEDPNLEGIHCRGNTGAMPNFP